MPRDRGYTSEGPRLRSMPLNSVPKTSLARDIPTKDLSEPLKLSFHALNGEAVYPTYTVIYIRNAHMPRLLQVCTTSST